MKVLRRELCIVIRDVRVTMAEHVADGLERLPSVEESNGIGVANRVRARMRRLNARAENVPTNKVAHNESAAQPHMRSVNPNEHLLRTEVIGRPSRR